eukprot:TRINITY_DN10477_c0_g1_i1.p1 TRINITY_DN10477_c0_g1~~TRINITY_DN10477_c0_g1_i1.p1  ORF type:complete len:480 (-),score=87.29 TRINITY_DN10477_c0_g1_i1:184-1623(-)
MEWLAKVQKEASQLQKDASNKWNELTDDMWGPKSRLGQMMEASSAIQSQMEALEFKLSKREIAFGLYHDAHQRLANRTADPGIDAQMHADDPAPPRFLVEILLWYVDFVDWAYGAACNEFDPDHKGTEEDQLREKLASREYELVTAEWIADKEKPAHFIAFNHTDKLCLVVVCGSKSSSDGLTNAQIVTEPLYEGGPACHQGMARSARWICDRYQNLLTQVFAPAQYKLVCCGHSLGAGTAALVTELMHAKYGMSSECFGFATPACVELNAAARMDSVTTVVLRDDIIPRGSVAAVYKTLVRLRKANWEELAEGEWIQESFKADVSSQEFVLEKATAWARNSMLDIHKKNQTRDPLQEVPIEVLAVPGNIVHLYQAEFNNDESYAAALIQPDNPVLEFQGSYSMMADHAIEGYRDALSVINEQVAAHSPMSKGAEHQPPPPLPQAASKVWKKYTDPSSGQDYWHCAQTNETTWEQQKTE